MAFCLLVFYIFIRVGHLVVSHWISSELPNNNNIFYFEILVINNVINAFLFMCIHLFWNRY